MLDLHSTQEKFGSFLRAALDVLSQLLELATLNDINKVSGWLNSYFIVLLTTSFQSLHGLIHGTCFDSVWRKSWATSSPVSPENQPWLLCVYSRSVMCEIIAVSFVWQFLFSFSTEQCAATGATPHRSRLVPADRACKVIGFPVRWFHTLYSHILNITKQAVMVTFTQYTFSLGIGQDYYCKSYVDKKIEDNKEAKQF